MKIEDIDFEDLLKKLQPNEFGIYSLYDLNIIVGSDISLKCTPVLRELGYNHGINSVWKSKTNEIIESTDFEKN